MSEIRKLSAILVADIGYSRNARVNEEGTLARLRSLWSDLRDPAIAARRGRVVKRTGEGAIAIFQASWTPCALAGFSRGGSGLGNPERNGWME